MYYDKLGRPISMLDWAERFEDHEIRKVRYTGINNHEVSTVWLGLDHQWGDGPPLIFETMINPTGSADRQWRHCTLEEAEQAHESIVAQLKAGCTPSDLKL